MDNADIHPCPNCKAPFPVGATMCLHCGWTHCDKRRQQAPWLAPLRTVGSATLGFVCGFVVVAIPSAFFLCAQGVITGLSATFSSTAASGFATGPTDQSASGLRIYLAGTAGGLIVGRFMYLFLRAPKRDKAFWPSFAAGVAVGALGVMVGLIYWWFLALRYGVRG
jgi:hypothetical protein